MAVGVDLVCAAFFVVLTILGPDFYELSDVDWVGWCHGLNLGMGLVVIVAGISQRKQEPTYASTGVVLGTISIYLGFAPFMYLK